MKINVLSHAFAVGLVAAGALVGGTNSAVGQVLAEGSADIEPFMAYRGRQFNNGGGSELFVGVPDLGVGSNRASANALWAPGDNNRFTMEYVRSLDRLDFTLENLTLDLVWTATYEGWLQNARSIRGQNFDHFAINAANFSIFGRDVGQEVLVRELELNGVSIQSGALDVIGVEIAETPSVETYSITDFCFVNNDDDGFLLTGRLQLGPAFSGSAERSKIELQVGIDELGPICTDRIFFDGFESFTATTRASNATDTDHRAGY